MASSVSADATVALVVLDFDGTLTDVDACAWAFHDASADAVAHVLGIDRATARREWADAAAEVTGAPVTSAWLIDGRPVCPAAVDPYVIANMATRMVLERERPALGERDVLGHVLGVHRAAYARVAPALRPDARDTLAALTAGGRDVAVVSNSASDAIAAALDALALPARDRIRVRGEAHKFHVGPAVPPDARFAALPDTVDWWQDGRPIHVRRGRYFAALRELWDVTGTGPESTLVAGDVFELDLAMPSALGAAVHLVARDGTMPHEVALARSRPRGGTSRALAGVLERIG